MFEVSFWNRLLRNWLMIISSVSISTRRPNMLRFTTWMAECVDYLETSQDAAPTDKRLVAWVRLQRIMEEFGTAFAFDDPSETVSLIEPRTQLMLKGFEKKLEIWKSNTPSLVLNGKLSRNPIPQTCKPLIQVQQPP